MVNLSICRSVLLIVLAVTAGVGVAERFVSPHNASAAVVADDANPDNTNWG